MEITFALIKPHVVKNTIAFKHIKNIITRNFTVLESKEIIITNQLAAYFYKEHLARFFYNRLLAYMNSGPSFAFILASKDSISKWRALMGPTKVFEAIYTNPYSIRGLYGLTDTRNACHGSDSVKSAVKEISIIFPNFNYIKPYTKN